MQFTTPLLLALASATQIAAFDLYYFCTQNTQGACCMDLDPAAGAGKSCNPSTSVYSFVDPGAPQWVCLNNVNRVPACCLGPVKGGSMKCEPPIEPPFPSATPRTV